MAIPRLCSSPRLCLAAHIQYWTIIASYHKFAIAAVVLGFASSMIRLCNESQISLYCGAVPEKTVKGLQVRRSRFEQVEIVYHSRYFALIRG